MDMLPRGCQREDAGEEVTVGEVEVGEAEMPPESPAPPACL